LTHDYLFQVSDRRLVKVSPQGDVIKVVDDDANKSIFYCGHIAFGYTGLAEIAGERSDYWLLENLPIAFETFHKVIKEKATEAFKKIHLSSKLKRHAFVGIRWIRTQKTGPLCPSVISISNFQDERGGFLPSANESFSVHAIRVPSDVPLMIYPVGQSIDKAVLELMHRNIRECLERKTNYREILRLLVLAMRKIAKRNEKVGSNLMAVGMPKSAVGNMGFATPLKGVADYVENINTFMYFPSDSSNRKIYSPHTKCGRITQADFEHDPRDGNFETLFSIKISSTAPDHFNIGMDLLKKHKYEDAIMEFDKAIELKPGFTEAWTGKGIAVGNLGRIDESLELFNKAIKINPDDVEAWYQKGFALGKLERFEEALKAFKKVIAVKPDDTKPWVSKGVVLGYLGRHEEALEAYKEVIKRSPDDYEIWFRKGITLGYLGRHGEAFEAFSKVIELRPNHANAWYNRACYYAIKDDKANIIKDLSKAIYFDNTYKKMARKEKIFKSLLNDEDFKKLIE
jgi:tetratricopeptide (TPR) repeat protein